jgi:hypothetical protein
MTIIQSREVGVVALNPWGKALAGAVAAMLANIIVYPLDLAKTRLQVQNKRFSKDKEVIEDEDKNIEYYTSTVDVLRKVYERGGLKALYNGLLGSLAGTVSTNFAYFYWYSLLRGFYIRKYSLGFPLTTAVELILGAAAGAVAQIFTIPVSVITTRQQTTDTSFSHSAKAIYYDDGITGLWRGLKASLVLVINPSLTYGTSSRLRTVLFGNRANLTVNENFILGAISKSIATIVTQPLIVAKVMQQSSKRFSSFLDVISYLLKNGGIQSLFKGLGPQLSKGILVQGLLLAFKDKVERYIVTLLLSINRKSRTRFAIQIM